MAMNSSGPISLGGATAGQSINLENGFSATAQVSLNDTAVRNLAGVASGAITMPTNFYGKSNRAAISYTFSANTANASLNLSTISGYAAGTSDITVTINAGVYLYATSTGGYGLNLSGGTTGDTLTIVNNGFIMGQGGVGGRLTTSPSQAVCQGGSAGPALNLGFGMSSCTINNTNGSAYIGGGGGGGAANYYSGFGSGGGGAGGGNGGPNDFGYPQAIGGSVGNSGGTSASERMGGAGGRIFPGVGGAAKNSPGGPGGAGGGAGGGGYSESFYCCGGYIGGGSGGGGGWGASGGSSSSYYSSTVAGGNGGSANNAGGNATGGGSGNPGPTYPGGSGGKAVNLNGKSVTWTSGNTTRVYGAVS